jgi:hypothetical protein
MAEGKPVQAVVLEVGTDRGQAWLRLSTPGVSPITIPIEPQAAFECAEQLARAAHTAKYGKPPQSDKSYLAEQIKSRVTDQIRDWMVNRVTHMLRTLRTNPAYPDRKLAETLVDTVMTKVV